MAYGDIPDEPPAWFVEVKRQKTLREVATWFCEAVEREAVIRLHRARYPGGQHVPNHGDFHGAPPSTFAHLERFARDLRAALVADLGEVTDAITEDERTG